MKLVNQLGAVILLFLSYFSHAQDITPLSTCTQVSTAPDGAQVIRIAEPSDYQISHNVFSHFHVPKEGLVFVNTDQDTFSSLAGHVDGNPNLSGFAARWIINKVTHPSPSELLGHILVAGFPANVVFANPYGIYCNGCRLLNATLAALITGKPEFDLSGRLQSFDGVTQSSRMNVLQNNQGMIDAKKNLFIRANHFQNHGTAPQKLDILLDNQLDTSGVP